MKSPRPVWGFDSYRARGQKRFPPEAGSLSPRPEREAFFVSDRLDCNSEGKVMQEVSDGAGDADFEGQ